MTNELTVAVAGARKTQSIVDACCRAATDQQILILGYTQSSQREVEGRVRAAAPFKNVEVLGWYSFLLRHFISPYLTLLFPGESLRGFNYEGDPGRFAKDSARYLDAESRAYKLHLSKLACLVAEASNGSVVDRLEHIYHDIYIDEVQDLCGFDLDILEILFRSKINIHLVGDMRQAVLATNVRDPRLKKYRFDKVINWFALMEKKDLLIISHKPETYRCNQQIADFSDSIFDPALGYPPTVSLSTEVNAHMGLFRVDPRHAQAYLGRFAPLCQRHSANSGRSIDLPFVNFGQAKGRTVDHVLIYPTKDIRTFLEVGGSLQGTSAARLYVGVTRAKHSVAFLLEPKYKANLQVWNP